LHSNAVILTWSWYDGGLNFNGAIPLKDARGTYNVPAFSIYHSFRFFGRSANITASLLYAVGNFTGELFNQERFVYRSGLLDFGARFSVNLYGGRAMELPQFASGSKKYSWARASGLSRPQVNPAWIGQLVRVSSFGCVPHVSTIPSTVTAGDPSRRMTIVTTGFATPR